MTKTSEKLLNYQKRKAQIKKILSKNKTNWENLPENWYESEGFVYKITNKLTSKAYIGKKSFYTRRKGRIVSISDWETYKGSSLPLLEDILNFGAENFTYEVLIICASPRELTYKEIEEQFKHDVLYKTLPNGEYAFYNENINSKHYRPKDFGTPEYIAKCENISKSLREGFLSGKITHPLKGKVHPNKGKKLPQTGHHKNKNKTWYTNGESNRLLSKDDLVPDGFYIGMVHQNIKKPPQNYKEIRKCRVCDNTFPVYGNKVYCSTDCKKEWNKYLK